MEQKTGLVLEGGGMRGIYTAGVLDLFMDQGVTFDGVIGVSAGAIHGCSFLSGQRGRNIRYYKKALETLSSPETSQENGSATTRCRKSWILMTIQPLTIIRPNFM